MKGIAVRLLIIGAIGLGAFIFRDRLSGNAGDLAVGDCFDVPTTVGETIDDVQHRPCDENHTGEVMFVGDHDAAAYPGDDGFDPFVQDRCIPAFNAYTGLVFENEPALGIGYFTPTAEGWDDGDKKIICYISRMDGAVMTESVKAATD